MPFRLSFIACVGFLLETIENRLQIARFIVEEAGDNLRASYFADDVNDLADSNLQLDMSVIFDVRGMTQRLEICLHELRQNMLQPGVEELWLALEGFDLSAYECSFFVLDSSLTRLIT